MYHCFWNIDSYHLKIPSSEQLCVYINTGTKGSTVLQIDHNSYRDIIVIILQWGKNNSVTWENQNLSSRSIIKQWSCSHRLKQNILIFRLYSQKSVQNYYPSDFRHFSLQPSNAKHVRDNKSTRATNSMAVVSLNAKKAPTCQQTLYTIVLLRTPAKSFWRASFSVAHVFLGIFSAKSRAMR